MSQKTPILRALTYSDLPMYIFLINGGMGAPFQARSRYFSRLAVLKLS